MREQMVDVIVYGFVEYIFLSENGAAPTTSAFST